MSLFIAELTPQSATRRQTFPTIAARRSTHCCRLNPNKFTDTPLVKNNSFSHKYLICYTAVVPWFTIVYHGIRWYAYHGIPWYTMLTLRYSWGVNSAKIHNYQMV